MTNLDGEYVYWYYTVGEPAARMEYDLDTDYVSQSDLIRDYQYMDYETGWLYWDEENEIWKSNGEFRHSYGHQTYFPDIVNDYYNQGEPGMHYPGHKYYYSGSEGNDGYYITWGTACQNDLTHHLRSDVYEGSRDDELAKSAVERKLDRFDPEVNVWLSDMRYEEKDDVIGWTYTKRTEPELVTKNLSCIADERKEVEFIPLNTRLESYSYRFNESTLFWKSEPLQVGVGDWVEANGTRFRTPKAFSIPRQVAEMYKESIVYLLHAERKWPDREFMPEAEAMALRDKIVNEIPGMDKVPRPKFAIALDYMDELEAGDLPLVINGRWQASYDEWDRRWKEKEESERENR